MLSYLNSITNILQKLNPHQDIKPQCNSIMWAWRGPQNKAMALFSSIKYTCLITYNQWKRKHRHYSSPGTVLLIYLTSSAQFTQPASDTIITMQLWGLGCHFKYALFLLLQHGEGNRIYNLKRLCNHAGRHQTLKCSHITRTNRTQRTVMSFGNASCSQCQKESE